MSTSLYLKGEERFGPFTSRLYSKFSTTTSKRLYGILLEKIREYHPSDILDVGCGPGDILSKIYGDFKDMGIYGVDPSPNMVQIARKRVAKKGGGQNVNIEVGSSRIVPFNRKFDMIITSFSYHHWMEQERSLDYLLGLLKESGRLIIFELNADGYPGKLPFVKKHSLSRHNASQIEFPGYGKEIEFSNDNRLIIVIFHKTG